VAFNSTLVLALRFAPQIGTPGTGTVPTSATATELWADAVAETAAAFRRARLADSGLTGLAAQTAEQIEALLTSGYCLLSKGSIGKDATATAEALLARARVLMADLQVSREMWIAEGVAEEATRTNPFVRSREVDDADPLFDWTPGTGDIPYSETDLWPYSPDDL
jgi:hypothetical protein